MINRTKNRMTKSEKIWSWLEGRNADSKNFYEVLEDGKFNLSSEEERKLFLMYTSKQKIMNFGKGASL